MEFALLEHSKRCQSSKKTERSRGVKELSELLCSPAALKLLRDGTSDTVDWAELFRSANEAILLESNSWKTDEAKESSSASATSRRENAKTQFASLVKLILRKSNIPNPSISFRVVLDACLPIFDSGYLRKNFGLLYIGLIRDHVLPFRKFRASIKSEEWEQLFSYCLSFLKSITTNTESPLVRSYFELTDSVVVHGYSQSHLGILVKNKLLPLLESKLDIFLKFLECRQLFLSLSLHTCVNIAKESRTGVCHFGELALSSVIQIYDPRQEEDCSQNKFAVDFMLLQMQCHHPTGEKEGTRAAYACDWKVWKRHMQAMYRKCVSNVIQKKGTTHHFSDAFLELCTELCKQMLDKANNVFEEPSNQTDLNESDIGPSSKRRKLINNTSELFEELESSKTDVVCCPLIVLVTQILKKYPTLFGKDELYQLLDILSEMQCNCKDQELLTYILGCSQQLMNEMLKRKLCMDPWRKVWEALPRSIGLNQREGHLLLQTFIINNIAPASGLPTLLRMFQSSMIRPSNFSLQTLMILLSCYHLPETSKSADSNRQVSPWDLSVSSARIELMDWLFSSLSDSGIKKQLVSRVIVLLVVNLKNKLENTHTNEETQSASLRESSLETDYCVSAFASGLLLTSDESNKSVASNKPPFNEESTSYDHASFEKLNWLVKSKFQELEEKFVSLQEGTASTQRARNLAGLGKTKVELTCEIVNFTHLLVSLSSGLIKSGALTFEAFETSLFHDVSMKTMDFLKGLLLGILKCDSNEAITVNVERTYQVLEPLRELYHCSLLPSINFFLRRITCTDIIVQIAKIFTSFPQHEGNSDDWENPHSTPSRLLQEVKQPFALTGTTLTDVEILHFCCLDILSLYGCTHQGTSFHKHQYSVIEKIFRYLSDTDLYDPSLESTFSMMCYFLSNLLTCEKLKSENHLRPAMKLLQTLCRKWNQDAEASSYIMLLLKKFLKHVEVADGKEFDWERVSWLTLFSAFKSKKFGPKFTIQFISCFEVLLKVDQNCTWARWKNASDLRDVVDSEIRMPTEAVRRFEDGKGNVAVIEEAIIILLNPFHEVRTSTVSIVASLFKGHDHDQQWMNSMFKRLSVVLHELYIVKLEDMSREETIDEGSNRTAIVLHVLAAIAASSIKCYESAIILIFRLLKDKNLDKGLVKRVFDLLAESMKLHNIQKLLHNSLAYILENWLLWKYQLVDFPVSILNFPTFSEFFNCFRGIILPVVWRNKEQPLLLKMICQETKYTESEIFEVSFPSIYAQHIVYLVSGSAGSESIKMAIKLFDSFTTNLGPDKIKGFLLSRIYEVLVELTRLVWDPLNHEQLLGLNLSHLEGRPPFMCRDSFAEALKFLKGTTDCKSDFLVHLGQEKPHIIQEVLLHLREDMTYAVTLNQRLKTLHNYTIFVHALACYLANDVFANLADFLLNDITYTLLYLLYENKPNPGMMDVCIGCLSFLHVLYDHLLPSCAVAIANLLPTIVGSLIPLAVGEGKLQEKSHHILRMLIISKKPYLKGAISQLPPFPAASQFEDYSDIHDELKYERQAFTLEDEMNHFLSSVGNSALLANQNSVYDGLLFLGKQLRDKKNELLLLYQNLEQMRGFSQDCQASVMHRLIHKLIILTSSEDQKVQLEASRCLGQLGPADLTTLVLRPAEGCINLVKDLVDAMMCVMALAVHCLADYLLDHDVNVVKTASCALLKLMACKGSNKLLNEGIRSQGVPSKKISPFILQQNCIPKPSLASSSNKISNALCNHQIWCPNENVNHEEWITQLTCTFFDSLSEHDVFKDLSCLCKVKTSFAEKMLPVLFYLGLSHSTDICRQLCGCLAKFFEHHCACVISMKNSQTSSSGPVGIYLNRASVQCMLNVVNYARLQKSSISDQNVSLDLNYLHIASAAQFCHAYLSSVMYLELGCNSEKRDLNFDGSNVAYIDHLAEVNPEAGFKLQTLLTKAYEEIGDFDALYGCGSSMLLDRNTRANQYEYAGDWDKALLNYDIKSSTVKNVHSAAGLVNALQHSGLLNLVTTFVGSLPCDQKDQLQPAQLECMWRLGQWDVPLSSPKSDSFEWNRYSALLAYRDGNTSNVPDSILLGRLSVINELAHSSLENCKNIYRPLAQLQALQELEDFVVSGKIDEIISQWSNERTLPHSDIFLLESILAQRAKLMEILISKENLSSEIQDNSNCFVQALAEHYLRTAQLARKEEKVQIAEQWLHALSVLPNLSLQNKWQLGLEEAQLAWSSRKGLSDGTSLIARKILGSLLKELKASEFSKASIIYPQALIIYGRWMAETHSENPQLIIEEYLEEALQLLEDLPATEAIIQEQLEAHMYLAHFADFEYQRIQSYIKSESFQRKEECMKSLSADVKEVKDGKGLVKEELTAVKVTLQLTALDNEEIKNTRADKNKFMELAMRHYLISMKLGHGTNVPVFRMVSLWLENACQEGLNELVTINLRDISTYKFVPLLPQLVARLGDNMNDPFSKAIYEFLVRCCIDHPHHTLPLILALANSYEDMDRKAKPEPEPRVIGASRMLSELRGNKLVRSIIEEMDMVVKSLISLAYAEVPSHRANEGYYNIPKSEKVHKLRHLQHAMLPIINLQVQADAQYPDIIGIHSFDIKYKIAGGINKPKIIKCQGTDGITRTLLVKGKDDLRQDAVMQQVFGIMNSLLQTCKDTKSRRLSIRTYKIVPLSQRCGVLEWCENTSPMQVILHDVHNRYCKKDWKNNDCHKKIQDARPKSDNVRLKVFKEICKNFHPAFRFFFTEKFPTPAEWFDHRLAYVHSVATNSMVGYILGLGDRHISNILIDKRTAELIHIDFGIAFEQGKVLPTPETVPFRLSRDIVDGMGVSGVEGVFRRSCEKTMSVLRKNQEKILTILEVLLYDPLYAWALTPKMVLKHQRQSLNSSRASIASDSSGNDSNVEKNKMAERALSRVREKLHGTEGGPVTSIEGQVNRLIHEARDLSNLSRLFQGWQAWF